MSCNGCRVLRKGCGEKCVLRPCLVWIESPDGQGNATLFVSKFFGRSDLINYISSVPYGHQRIALFQSLLYEAVGRTVNPVNGAMGLLSTGNWHLCEAAVQTVLAGGEPTPLVDGIGIPEAEESSEVFQARGAWAMSMIRNNQTDVDNCTTVPQTNVMNADDNNLNVSTMPASNIPMDLAISFRHNNCQEPKLLNLFQ